MACFLWPVAKGTRCHYARHAVEIIVNGASRGQAEFELLL